VGGSFQAVVAEVALMMYSTHFFSAQLLAKLGRSRPKELKKNPLQRTTKW
tara:strand:+ start:2673 stop:2822 length:150 start_codon:yes stop_codon:yes gene_type:complete